jgi:hypothetical protein
VIDLFLSFDRVSNEFSPSLAIHPIPRRRPQFCPEGGPLRYRLRKSPGCYCLLLIQISSLIDSPNSKFEGKGGTRLWRESGSESRFTTARPHCSACDPSFREFRDWTKQPRRDRYPSRPALRRPTIRCSTISGCHQIANSWRESWAISGLCIRRVCRASFAAACWPSCPQLAAIAS